MLDINKHRHILFELIRTIYSSPLSGLLGFKGGTMAYFFYGLDRFSVDLDFDLLDGSQKDKTRSLMADIIKNYGTVKENTDKRFTIFFLLNYGPGNRNIKIEINKRNLSDSGFIISSFYGTDVKIQKIEDAFATKLLACTTRKRVAYRDFYDVYFYLKKGIIPNEKIIKKVSHKNTAVYLKGLIKFINEKVTTRSVLHGVGELIDTGQKDFIKRRFKDELLAELNFIRSKF